MSVRTTRVDLRKEISSPRHPLLRRLRRERLLETYWQESAAGPPRQYYTITAEGRRHLEALRREWRAVTGAVDRLLGSGGKRDER